MEADQVSNNLTLKRSRRDEIQAVLNERVRKRLRKQELRNMERNNRLTLTSTKEKNKLRQKKSREIKKQNMSVPSPPMSSSNKEKKNLRQIKWRERTSVESFKASKQLRARLKMRKCRRLKKEMNVAKLRDKSDSLHYNSADSINFSSNNHNSVNNNNAIPTARREFMRDTSELEARQLNHFNIEGILTNNVNQSPEFLDSVKEARQRTFVSNCLDDNSNSDFHRAAVCVVCDRLIIGYEEISWISKELLLKNEKRLSVLSYEEHHKIFLKPELVRQYDVGDNELQGLLLSPRSARNDQSGEYECCTACKESLQKNHESVNPPKYAIANGFVIGSIPPVITLPSMQCGEEERERVIMEDDLSDILCSCISPVRPFGYVHAYSAGSQKAIKGHFSLFSVNQGHVGGVLNKFRNTGSNPNIFVVLCGRMTPKQKALIKKKAVLDTSLFLDLLTWFVTQSGHPGYKDVTVPGEGFDPVFVIEEYESENNTDVEVNREVEGRFEGATYYFSSQAHTPSQQSSVFDSNKDFAAAMLSGTTPTLLMYGGNYVKSHEIKLEDAFPIQFPFGIGGPSKHERRVPVSIQACLSHYMRLSLKQFMKADFILVCYHLLSRILSYSSGLIKCKSEYKGRTLAEQISRLSPEDIELAVEVLDRKSENQHIGSISENDSIACTFLKRVQLSCQVLGHTNEAAKVARRNIYAMSDLFGLHSIFFTITPDDECSYRVRMFANQGKPIKVPKVDCSEEECILDFRIRKRMRLKYPGACSLEYQSVIQFIMKLLGWNEDTQSGSEGIFGILEAFVRAAEEQGRGTLHSHWIIWIRGYSWVRSMLFHPNPEKRRAAKEEMLRYINKIMTSTYGNDFEVKNVCCGCTGFPDDVLDDSSLSNLQAIRNSRHKTKCMEVMGRVMTCKLCKERNYSSVEVVNTALSRIVDCKYSQDDISIPLTRERIEIASYRYLMDERKGFDDSTFWTNDTVRKLILKLRFDEHDWKHRASCFKKGKECRANMPVQSCSNTHLLIDDDPQNMLTWKTIEGNTKEIRPFSIVTTRNQGSQFLNTSNSIVSRIACCNCNLQAGDNAHMYYTASYVSKNTQGEDRVDFDRIGKQCIRRMQRMKNEIDSGRVESDDLESFKEGLSNFLLGMSIHLSTDVISAPMAHLLVCQQGSRFNYSHEFVELLVGQMINHIDGKEPGDFVLRRRNRGDDGNVDLWADYSINDYVYRSEKLESICFYEFAMKFEKKYLTFKQMAQLADDDEDIADDCYLFQLNHPGRRYCCAKERKKYAIPRMSIPKDYLCSTDDLMMSTTNNDDNEGTIPSGVLEKRELYAKTALILFCPFRDCSTFINQETSSFWECFRSSLQSNKLWRRGINILNNIQERKMCTKLKRIPDPLHDSTSIPCDDDGDCSNVGQRYKSKPADPDEDDEDAEALSDAELDEYYKDEENGGTSSAEEKENVFTLQPLLNRANLTQNSLINPRLSESRESIFKQDEEEIIRDERSGSSNGDQVYEINHLPPQNVTYPTLLAFVQEATVRTSENQNDIYAFTGMVEEGEDNGDLDYMDMNLGARNYWGTNLNIGPSQWSYRNSMPTLREVARRVARAEKILLDRKQYLAYEIIAASFLLDLLKERRSIERENENYDDMISNNEDQMQEDERLIKHLENIGAKKQLLMFMTGPAGAGKSTAIKVAKKFCSEFCRCAGILWTDKSFFFTAMSGSAAALFGGVTLHSAAYLNKETGINTEEKREWDHVRMLIVDEISFCSVEDMNRLNTNLQQIRREKMTEENTPYGGLSIIFCGDFHQLLPVKKQIKQWLFADNGIWESSLNVVVILDNGHRFKNDPEFGKILKKFWDGTFTKKDCDFLNSRVISDKVVLPKMAEAKDDLCYACPKNAQRVSIHSQLFAKHIENFPGVGDAQDPPLHTVIIEANVNKRGKKRGSAYPMSSKLRKKIIESCGDSDIRQQNTKIDPALKLYVGAHCMCNVNEDVSSGIANGTVCTVSSIKFKQGYSPSWKNWEGKKVYSTTVNNVEYIELERTSSSFHRNKFFRLHPKKFSAIATSNFLDDPTGKKQQVKVSITQFPLNSNDATTGHKLQGMSISQLIVQSWCYRTPNWIYTVLSRVRSFDGLFLVEPLRYKPEYFEVPKELQYFKERIKHKVPTDLQ